MVVKIELSKELIKRQIPILKDSLNEKISTSAAYNVLSKMYGFENWNTLSAFLNNNDDEE